MHVHVWEAGSTMLSGPAQGIRPLLLGWSRSLVGVGCEAHRLTALWQRHRHRTNAWLQERERRHRNGVSNSSWRGSEAPWCG